MGQILKTAMFATVVILRAVIGRSLIDHVLASPQLAPLSASQALLMLRNIHFISSRLGSNAFSAYTFVNITSIDILTRFPASSLAFLRTIYPSHAGQIPASPLQRNHDLFYVESLFASFPRNLSPRQFRFAFK